MLGKQKRNASFFIYFIWLRDVYGNHSASNLGVYNIPCDSWLEGEMRLFDDRIEANFNGNSYLVYGDVKSLFDAYGGLYLRVGTIDDYTQLGFDLDWIEIDKKPTIEQLVQLKHRLYEEGSINNSGIVKSLDAKLNAAQKALELNRTVTAVNILKAFVAEVSAQSGTHISKEAASKLVLHAEEIISSLLLK